VDVKKIVVLVVVALVLFFLISSPDQSAQMVKDILTGLRGGAEAIITFVKQLVA
jgi:preprotein translocase subunit YajC